MLYVGEAVGTGEGAELDVACDPLEGTTICAKNLPNSLAVIAMAHKDSLLNAPDIYMEKIAIGPGYPDGLVGLNMSPAEAVSRLAEAKGVRCQRHLRLRARSAAARENRGSGARHRRRRAAHPGRRHRRHHPHHRPGYDGHRHLSGNGRRAGGRTRSSGAALHGRPDVRAPHLRHGRESRRVPDAWGSADPKRVYRTEDMASGDVLFAATGVTDGNMLEGVGFRPGSATTHTLVTRSRTGTQRWIKTVHKLSGSTGSVD
jgi:fructose-1,6-bisphosphatase II / sedoheptulose-1,7-bisphosphatase